MYHVEKLNDGELNRINKLFTELRDFLELYHDYSIRHSRRIVKETVELLDSDESDYDKFQYVVEAYKALYTGKTGLTEYHIWDNDYDKRMKLNEPLDRISDELWEIMKKYIT